MTTHHTPGPWHRNIKPATKYVTIYQGRNKHICHLAPGEMTPEEAEANLNLIMAAPDMLAALKNAGNILAAIATGDLKTVKSDSMALSQIREAIALATGK